MSKTIFKLFIDDRASRKFRNQLKQHDRGDPRVRTGEAMPEGKPPPKWFFALVDDLNNSPMFGD